MLTLKSSIYYSLYFNILRRSDERLPIHTEFPDNPAQGCPSLFFIAPQ